MTKIEDLITIHGGYAKVINLVDVFNDPTENRARMEHYMPVKSHREAFIRLSRALYPLDNRVYLLTGSYGTGKSHLCLMLANYLSLKASDPEMVTFFDNWSQREADEAEKVRNLRGEGRYLVALTEYGGSDDFESRILRAVQTAVEREGLQETWLDTHYQEAIRQLDRWQARQTSGLFTDFRTELTTRYPDWDLDGLRQELNSFSQEALNIFQELYEIVVDTEFSYSKDNLVPILQDFLANPKFRERYKGLVIIADEFGYILDRGNVKINVFQRFAEMCQHGVEGSQLIFVGTGHKPFRAYSAGGLSAADFSVAADRVTEVPLASEELELIIAAIVVPDKQHKVWQSDVAPNSGMFNRFALAASRMGIFKHLKGPELRNRIVENIYPMHPMATHCLIEMSTEVSSNARSVFAFFSGAVESVPVPGSYPWYLAQTEVSSGGQLNLYTTDLLTEYFENELRPENTDVREAVRQHIRNYRASMTEVQKIVQAELLGVVDPLVERILKVMLVYEISKIAPTFESLAFGLYCETPPEKSKLQNVLTNYLIDKKILFQSAAGIYEFRPSQAMDFESLIEQYKSNPDNLPEDLATEVTNLVSLGRGGEWLIAKNHNQPYDEDKRLKRIFVRPGDLEANYPLTELSQVVDFFAYHEHQMNNQTDWKVRYEGVIVYVICETDDEIVRARRTAEANQSKAVIVGVPHQPIPLRETVMNLRAALHIRDTENLDALSLLDRSRLQEDIIGDERRGTGFTGDFVKARQRYLDGKELTWYGQAGKLLIAQPKNEYEPGDELMGRRFGQRNTVPHPYLNQIHVSRFGPGKDVPLTDAVDALLRTHRSIEIDHSAAANRGEIRYLKNVLADSGALQQVAVAQGNIAQYQLTSDSDKFQAKLPALAAMLQALSALKHGETTSARKLLAIYADAPFGQGPIALSLFLAFAVRAFGDELRLQLQPGAVGYASLTNPDLMIALLNNEHPNAIFERQTISQATRSLLSGIRNLFSVQPGAMGQNHTVNEAYGALRDWWAQLSNLAQVEELYEPDTTSRDLVKLLRKNIDGVNPYRLLLEQIQTVYGYSEDAIITDNSHVKILEGLQRDKANIQDRVQTFKNNLLTRLLAPFNPSGNHYGDYQAAIENWYHSLGSEQQDEYASWHSNPSQSVIRRLRTIVNIETTFFEQLPADAGFGLGKVDNWHRDRGDEYVQMLTDALAHIQKNRVKVPLPSWKIRSVHKKQETTDGAQISFRGGVVLEVRAPESDVNVLLTNDNQDPRQAQQREIVEEKFELSVKRACIVKLVSQEQDGSFGQILTLSFINEDSKYEIAPITQQKLLEREYKFVYPEDKEALEVVLLSLMKTALNDKLVTSDEAHQILQTLMDKLKGTY